MELEEYRHDLISDVANSARANGSMDSEEFVRMMVDELISAEVCGDFTPCYYSGETRRGKKMQVFGYDLDDFNTLSIFAADYNGSQQPETLSRSDILKIAERALTFAVEAMEGRIQQSIDESHPAHDGAVYLYNSRDEIDKFNIYVITDNKKSDRIKELSMEDAMDRKVEVYLWDIENVFDLMTSKKGYDDVVIDLVADFHVKGIPYLKASQGAGCRYDSYLCVMPGGLLCDLFAKYRGKLLESNVRSYLGSNAKNKKIKGTAVKNPDLFFAFNNGITSTAIGIETEDVDGTPMITQFSSLQIVNGGQTTVSLFDTRLKDNTDMSQVFVPMKLTVIPGEEQGDIVPDISKAANTQNAVKPADFFSNHPFHKKMHELSQNTRAPVAPGKPTASKWFYENARGQYTQQQLGMTKAEKDKFVMTYPKENLITKTDLARYRISYEGFPYMGRERERSFKKFADEVAGKYDKDSSFVNELYFKESVALAIVFRKLDKLIPKQDWYDKGYKAQTVNYSVAKLASMLEEHNVVLDFMAIWERQDIPEALGDQLLLIAERVRESFVDSSPEGNVDTWTRKEACWLAVKRLNIGFVDGIQDCVIKEGTSRTTTRIAARTEREKKGVNDKIEVVNLGYEYWKAVYEWALEHNTVDGWDKDLLRKALKMEYGKLPSEKESTSLIKLRDRLLDEGMRFRRRSPSVASNDSRMRSAIIRTTGTETEFPICLYLWESPMPSTSRYLSGNPWRPRHSSGVSFLMRPSLSRIRGTLWPPVPMLAISVGHSLLLFSLR